MATQLTSDVTADSVMPGDTSESESIADGDVSHHHAQVDTRVSPSELTYTGDATIPITTELHIVTPGEETPSGIWPIFRLMVSQFYTDGCTGTPMYD